MYDKLTAWLRLSAERIHDQANDLTALDRAIGDGDHGINMDRGFTAIVAMLDSTEPPVATTVNDAEASATLLKSAGRKLISTVGGASGPLYGTAFLRAAAAIAAGDGKAADTIVAAIEAAAGGIAGLGKSAPGEKTMLDAIVPAAQAARGAVDAGSDAAAVATAAAEAAAAGAVATIPMLATKGRASYLGERSIGHQDPGATSSALLLRALADVASA